MKYIRLFGSTSQRDAVLTSIDYKILQKTVGVPGVSILHGHGGGPFPPSPDPTVPFYIEDISGSDNIVQITKTNEGAPTLTIEKSTDGTTWTTMGTTSTTEITATIPTNGKLYLRCSTNTWSNSSYHNIINITGNCNVGGNIMSLLYGSNFTGNETTFPSSSTYVFCRLFDNNTHLVDASNLLLPATTLAWDCYNVMFRNCTSLTAAPALPATTVANDCYMAMFYNCTSLTTAPELPATTLAVSCYQCMFQGCSSLTTAPVLPATTLDSNCYAGMFIDCTSLTTAPVLQATTLATGCYNNMFRGCTSLTTAPELPATTLAKTCYQYMFSGCSSLNYIKCLATNKSATNCTQYWVQNVASTGTFVKDPNMSGWGTGANDIPSGWTVQDAA